MGNPKSLLKPVQIWHETLFDVNLNGQNYIHFLEILLLGKIFYIFPNKKIIKLFNIKYIDNAQYSYIISNSNNII